MTIDTNYAARLVTFNRIANPDWEPTRHTYEDGREILGRWGKRGGKRQKRSVLGIARKVAAEDGDTPVLRTMRDDLIRARHIAGGKIAVELDAERAFRSEHPITETVAATAPWERTGMSVAA